MTLTHTKPLPASGAAATKITVGTSSTVIVPANGNRRAAIIQVISGGPVYISPNAATTNDFPVPSGGALNHENVSAVNGIVTSGSADVRVWEEVG
jgi:DNA-directed RNA polymerase beta' subunit